MLEPSPEGRVEIIQTKERGGKFIPGRGNSRFKDPGAQRSSPVLGKANCLTRMEGAYLHVEAREEMGKARGPHVTKSHETRLRTPESIPKVVESHGRWQSRGTNW